MLRFAKVWGVVIPCFGLTANTTNAATYVVSNTLDRYVGTLRQAIIDANATPDADVILIDLPPEANVISLTTLGSSTELGDSALPEISGSLTIIGNGATIQPGPHAPPFRFFTVPFRSELTLVDLSLMGGSRPQGISNVKFYGGAILAMGALTMDQVRIEASSAESGGAVSASGSVTIYDSVIQGNLAGDGVVLIGGSNFLSDTTIANNIGTGCVLAYGQAKFERCAIMGNRFYGGLVVYRASATLTNCTISGNESFGNPFGGAGGAGVSFAGTTNDSLMLDHCTVTDNASIYGAGGVQNEYDDYYSATMKFSHSVIAGQRSGGNCSFHGLAGVPSVSDGYNLDTDGTCGLNQPTDRPNTDPRLGPLADNGGLTMTHALLPGSPAINLIPASQCTVDTDQRGFARPHGGACDVGAFEFACDPATSCSAKGSCNDDDSCVCDSGWTRADCSQDIDECANGTDNCDANATCTNTPGSFACACNDGYLGDGLSCALDTDGDGLPDVKDVCPHSDLSTMLSIDGCDTGVSNMLQKNGCTMADDVLRCKMDARNHGAFVSCVSTATSRWSRGKLLPQSARGTIIKCAAHSKLP